MQRLQTGVHKLKRLGTCIRSVGAWVALSGSHSYLEQTGWLLSKSRGMPVDSAGKPIPWITYSSMSFLESRAARHMRVFEYGCGSSTLWWAERVHSVVSCEHDREWYERMRPLVPANVQLTHVPLDGDRYVREVQKYRDAFDVIVIDGRQRVKCASNSPPALKPDGVLVWDNSEREHYRPGFDFLAREGFRRIDFSGMSPINAYGSSTAVLYRDANCLGL